MAPCIRSPGQPDRAGLGAVRFPSSLRSWPTSGPAAGLGTAPARASAGSGGRASRSCPETWRAALCHRLKRPVYDAPRTRQPAVAATRDDLLMNDAETLKDLVSTLDIG